MGDPEQESTVMGPLVDKPQYERVNGFIDRGVSGSMGQVITGGPKDSNPGGNGYFVEPTVFEGVNSDAEIYREEIFGPVSILNKFSTEEEVIKKANATEYGLMAGVFTQDINRAMRVAAEFDSGMVGVNCVSLTFLTAPFGGSKQSGTGRECGRESLEAFTENKTVMVNLTY